MEIKNIADEATRLTELLQGKVVDIVLRHRLEEILIKFEDGTCLFVNSTSKGLDFSVT